MLTQEPSLATVEDPKRLQALAATRLLDAEENPALQRIVAMAAKVLRSAVSLVSLVDDQRQFFAAHAGLPEDLERSRQTPISQAFCKYVVATESPLIVEDAHTHPVFKDHPGVKELDIVSYAGFPISTRLEVSAF